MGALTSEDSFGLAAASTQIDPRPSPARCQNYTRAVQRTTCEAMLQQNFAAGRVLPSASSSTRETTLRFLLFLFLHLAPCRFRLLNNLLLQLSRHRVVMMHFHVEAAATLRHRSQIHAVGEHLRHRHFGLHYRVAALVVHALDASPPAVQIAHDRARKIVRYRDLHRHHRLQDRWLSLLHRFPERDAPRHLE